MLSVVIPAYNEEKMIGKAADAIEEPLIREGIAYELLFIDDGSTDGTWKRIHGRAKEDDKIRGIRFSKNFGKESAIFAGLAYAEGDCVVVIDCDLQHPPEEIPKLVRAIQENPEVDVIIAKYQNRHHNLIRKLGTRISVYATSKMLKKDPNLEITSFRLMRRFKARLTPLPAARSALAAEKTIRNTRSSAPGGTRSRRNTMSGCSGSSTGSSPSRPHTQGAAASRSRETSLSE